MTLHATRAHKLYQICPVPSSQDYLCQRMPAACSRLSTTSTSQYTRLITLPAVCAAVLCDLHESYSITGGQHFQATVIHVAYQIAQAGPVTGTDSP